MTGARKKRRPDDVVAAYFEWQKLFRERLLAHPAAQRNPRLFALGYILSEMFDWENFSCHPSRETLAEKLGISVTQVSTLTQELADIRFICVKRRRNTSAIYTGSIPQEVNSASLPDERKSRAKEDQEVKSSPLRKASEVHFGKSSGVHPNVVRNVASNEGGGGPKPPAADISNSCSIGQPTITNDALPEPAPSSRLEAATGASSASEPPEDEADDQLTIFHGAIEPKAFLDSIDDHVPIKAASDEALRCLVGYFVDGMKFSHETRHELGELHRRGKLTKSAGLSVVAGKGGSRARFA